MTAFILDGFTCHRSDQENTYKKESHDVVEWIKKMEIINLSEIEKQVEFSADLMQSIFSY